MEVDFGTREHQRCYQKQAVAVRTWGPVTGRKYIDRINILYQAKSAQDLYAIPQLDFHPLTGNRQGQYALKLSGQMRLIVTFKDAAQTEVQIKEVSDHYGD